MNPSMPKSDYLIVLVELLVGHIFTAHGMVYWRRLVMEMAPIGSWGGYCRGINGHTWA